MDRLAATRRPDAPLAGTQRWRELLFLHWIVEPDVLRPLVPEWLSLDLWQGKAFLGVVPFRMKEVKPSWLPKAFAFDFLETNLRTYVHLEGQQPGVYFFSLEAASWLAVQAARIGWGLPYHYASMSSTREGSRIQYQTHRLRGQQSAAHAVEFDIGSRLPPSSVGSLEFFLAERYLLYCEHRGKRLCGQVHHVPYPLQEVKVLSVQDGLMEAAGFPPPASNMPDYAHYAEGVDVEVFALQEVCAAEEGNWGDSGRNVGG